LAAGLAASILCSIAQHICGQPLLPRIRFPSLLDELMGNMRMAGMDVQHPWADSEHMYSPSCSLVGTATFLLVYLFGHSFGRKYTIFLDKVCISQTDPEARQAGIWALDQSLLRSRTMLLCYDDDYFERLWCTFELAVRASSGSRIDMLPLWRAPTVLAISVGFTLGGVAEYVALLLYSQLLGSPPALDTFTGLSVCCHLLPICFMLVQTVKATRQKVALKAALHAYKVASTKCVVAADRPIVEVAISSLFGNRPRGDKPGPEAILPDAISRFETQVREGPTHEKIMASVGSQSGMLRLQDLLTAIYLVRIPACLDWSHDWSLSKVTHGSAYSLFLVSLVAGGEILSFTGAGFLLARCKRLRDLPNLLLGPILFVQVAVTVQLTINVGFATAVFCLYCAGRV